MHSFHHNYTWVVKYWWPVILHLFLAWEECIEYDLVLCGRPIFLWPHLLAPTSRYSDSEPRNLALSWHIFPITYPIPFYIVCWVRHHTYRYGIWLYGDILELIIFIDSINSVAFYFISSNYIWQKDKKLLILDTVYFVLLPQEVPIPPVLLSQDVAPMQEGAVGQTMNK